MEKTGGGKDLAREKTGRVKTQRGQNFRGKDLAKKRSSGENTQRGKDRRGKNQYSHTHQHHLQKLNFDLSLRILPLQTSAQETSHSTDFDLMQRYHVRPPLSHLQSTTSHQYIVSSQTLVTYTFRISKPLRKILAHSITHFISHVHFTPVSSFLISQSIRI